MKSEVKLLPCPFCGGEAKVFGPYGWYRQWGISHSCASFYSGAQEMFGGFPTKTAAIAAWNTRATPPKPEVADLVGRLRECLTPETYYEVSQGGPRTLVVRLRFPFDIDIWADGRAPLKEGMSKLALYEARDAERKRISDLVHNQMEAVGADAYRVLREIDERLGTDRVDYGVRHARWRRTREGKRPSPKAADLIERMAGQ
jgi:hypothetical protein